MGSWRMTWWYEVPPTFHATASRISERSSPKSLLWATLAPLYNSFRAYAAQFSGRSRPKSAVRSYTSFHTVGGRVRAGRALRYFQCSYFLNFWPLHMDEFLAGYSGNENEKNANEDNLWHEKISFSKTSKHIILSDGYTYIYYSWLI